MEVDRGRRNGTPEGFPRPSRDPDGSSASVSLSPPPSPCGVGSIEHRVSKLDTLAGIAIKYGVEVADIKRMNGLVTDLQMFAFKKLQIPSPGKHPPSPVLSDAYACNGEQTPASVSRDNVMDSFHSLKRTPPRRKVSDAMSNLQGYYGLTPVRSRSSDEGTEMSVYSISNGCNLEELKTPTRAIPSLDLPPTQNHKLGRPSQDAASATAGERVEMDLKGSGSSRNGKGLALRPKSGSRTDLASAANGYVPVRKSSSTPNLEDSDAPSRWSSAMWTLRTEAITRPLLDGLPKPITFLKIKLARD